MNAYDHVGAYVLYSTLPPPHTHSRTHAHTRYTHDDATLAHTHVTASAAQHGATTAYFHTHARRQTHCDNIMCAHARRREVARDYIQDALLLASRTRAWAATRPSNRVAIARRLLVGGIMYGIVGSGRACAVRSALLRVWWTVVVAAHCVWGRAVADRAFAGTVRRRRFAAVCVRVCGGLHRLERARRMTTMTNARAYGTQPQPQPPPQSQAESSHTRRARRAHQLYSGEPEIH